MVTFDPHPLEVLFPEKAPSFITSHQQKLDLIASCGIDATVVIPFDHEFSRMSAREFVEVVLVEKIGTRAIVVGHDYRFGHSREGDIPFLKQLGEQYGFEVEIVSGIKMNDTVVSSTTIRQMIMNGDIKEANKLLGRLLRGKRDRNRRPKKRSLAGFSDRQHPHAPSDLATNGRLRDRGRSGRQKVRRRGQPRIQSNLRRYRPVS